MYHSMYARKHVEGNGRGLVIPSVGSAAQLKQRNRIGDVKMA